MKIEGQGAIVTGGGQGLGRGYAHEVAEVDRFDGSVGNTLVLMRAPTGPRLASSERT